MKLGTLLIFFACATVLKSQKIKVVKSVDDKIRLRSVSVKSPLFSNDVLKQIFKNASKSFENERSQRQKTLLKASPSAKKNDSGFENISLASL